MKKYLLIICSFLCILCMLTGCAGKNSAAKVRAAEGSMQEASFSKEEYQKLLEFQFDGYEDMSISAYQEKAWQLMDKPEYFELIRRFSESEAFYECRDSDETASFFFYVLEPIAAERWEKREFDGGAMTDYSDCDDNAALEFTLTLMIQDKDQLTVREYQDARTGITGSLQKILQNSTEEQLQDASFMQTVIDREIDRLAKQWNSEKLKMGVEYSYMPLSAPEPDNTARDVNAPKEQERRDYPNGTKEDYKSLLALKTPDYQEMSLADFNRKLLDWANENYERMERINGDVGYHDFKLPLTEEERRFVICSTNFSGMENAKYVQSNYTGREETEPSLDRYLPEKTTIENDRSSWCDLYYRFSWKIMDKETLTVGERDRRIAGLLEDIQRFWDETELDILLEMDKSEIVKELQEIAESYSTEQLGITIMEDYVSFECMDERGIG